MASNTKTFIAATVNQNQAKSALWDMVRRSFVVVREAIDSQPTD